MNRHLAHFLIALYSVLAVGMWFSGLHAYQQDDDAFTALSAAACVGFAMAIVHQTVQRDELRAAHQQLDIAAHPLKTRQDQLVDEALNAACCEAWWASAGQQHDPQHCTRKDQTT